MGNELSFTIPTDCEEIRFSVHNEKKGSDITPDIIDNIIINNTNDGIIINGLTDDYDVTIYDITGRLINRFYVSKEKEFFISLTDTGIFTVVIFDYKNTFIKKVLK